MITLLLLLSIAQTPSQTQADADARAAIAIAKAARERAKPKAVEPQPPAETWPKITVEGENYIATLKDGRRYGFIMSGWTEEGVRKYLQKLEAAPAVAPPAKAKTFQSGDYNPSHTCPNCGTQQWRVQSGSANVSGHSHQCPSCGTVWWH